MTNESMSTSAETITASDVAAVTDLSALDAETLSTKLGVEIPHTEPGWVDALCVCGDSASHAGLFCPSRPNPAGVETEVSVAAAAAAAEADAAHRAEAIAAARATLAELGG